MDVLQHTRERYPGVEVVVITALDKVDPAVRAIKSGAAEYLIKPVKPEVLNHAVNRALMTRALLAENAALKRHLSLVEAGQRLLTMLDGPRLAQAATSAFLQLSQADGVLLWAISEGTVRLEASEGVAAEALRPLVVRYDAELRGMPARPFEARLARGPGTRARFPGGRGGAAPRLGAAPQPAGLRRGRPRDRRVPRPPPGPGLGPRGALRPGGGPGLPRRPHPPLQRALPATRRWSASCAGAGPSACSSSTSTTSRASTTPTATWWGASSWWRRRGW